MSRKWIIEHFTRLFFGYDRFIIMFLSDQMFCFDVILSCLFMWILSEISVVLCGFMVYFCYGYFRFYCDISILFLYDWLVIDLRWYYFCIIIVLFFCDICDNSMIFCCLSWFIVSCFLIDILINIIVCNALYYKDL